MDTTWIDDIMTLITQYALSVLGAILLLIGAWIASKWVRRGTARSLDKSKIDVTLTKFFSNITGWLVLLIGVIAALELFGIKTTSFVAVLGAAGLAIGLALQGTLSNFAAGVMLLIFRPFKMGDTVRIAGELGKIDEVDLFMTMMNTLDNRRIIIPNGKIFGDKIETLTYHPIRRIDVPVGTDYPADLDHVRRVLEQAAATVPGRLDEPKPEDVLLALGASSIDWEVRVWTKTPDFPIVKQATVRATKKALDEAGIGIPFPQMDVHLDGALSR